METWLARSIFPYHDIMMFCKNKLCEKRIDLYKRYLKKDELSDMDKLTLTNKKEWV